MNRERTLLSFDFGMKRIGVAVGQSITKTANPLVTLAAKSGVPDWSKLDALIKKWRPDAFVVGIPLNMDGSDQPITHAAREFSQALNQHTGLPVHEIDERLTTKAAREALFDSGGYKALQSGEVDQFAAKILLENWFARSI